MVMIMNYNYIPYAMVLAISSLIAIFLTFYTWKRKKVPGARYISLALLGVAFWSFSAILVVLSSKISSSIFWSQVSYIGVVSIAPLWLLFAATYTQNDAWFTKSRWLLLWVVPAFVLVLVFTNQWHGLIWPHVVPVHTGSGTVFVYDHGVGAWINVIYSYILMVVGMILLSQTVINSPGLYRYQAGLLLVGALVPMLLNAVYLADIYPDPGMDPTPFAFLVTGFVSAWSLLRFKFLNVMPVAHTTLFKSIEGGVVVLDAQNRVVEVNPAAKQLLGLDGEVLGETAKSVMISFQDFKEPHDGLSMHYEALLKSSKPCWVDVNVKPLCQGNESLLGYLISLNNITQIKTAEERSKKALEENELLMKEIHHRVKNNLTVISSLLSMQSRYVKDKDDLEMFIESQNRAKSMAMIHEMLYNSMGEFKRINFGLYIEKLSRIIFNAYTMDPSRIKLETDLENIQLDVDTAVPLGLILNELISNALKYAFPEGRKGTLRVTFKKEEDTNLLLRVEDDGVGVPEKNGVNGNSLGLILIKSLVEQINGNITVDNKNGLKINIRFPEMDYKKL